MERFTIQQQRLEVVINYQNGSSVLPQCHHHQWHDSPVWALAFLRSSRHSCLFSATLLQFLIPNVLMSCRTQSSHLILGTFFKAPALYKVRTFNDPNLKSFNRLPFRRDSVSPAVASSDFVTIVFLQIRLSAQCQPPAILVGRCFLLGLSPLADRSPFLSVGSSLLRPYMTWPLKALPKSHDVDMHVLYRSWQV